MPDVRKARRFGLAGVIIASIAILACNLTSAGYYAFLPSLAKMMRAQQKGLEKKIKEERAARLEELRENEAEAKTPAEKKAAHDELTDFEATPPMPSPPIPMPFGGSSDRRVLAMEWADILANLAFNIVMIVGCAGLIGLREWGRKTAIVAAIGKLVECVLITLLLVVVAAPIIGGEMGSEMNKLHDAFVSAPGGAPVPVMPVQDMRSMMTMFSAAGFVFAGILGLIWPIIMLGGITGKSVRAACVAGARERAAGAGASNEKPIEEWESDLS